MSDFCEALGRLVKPRISNSANPLDDEENYLSFAKTGVALLGVALDLSGAGDVTKAVRGTDP